MVPLVERVDILSVQPRDPVALHELDKEFTEQRLTERLAQPPITLAQLDDAPVRAVCLGTEEAQSFPVQCVQNRGHVSDGKGQVLQPLSPSCGKEPRHLPSGVDRM